MSLLLYRTGEIELLKGLITDPLTMRLFTNSVIPLKNSGFSSFNEVQGSGYSSKILTTFSWKFIEENAKIGLEYSKQSYLFLGPVDKGIYGYYITKKIKSKDIVMWAERFVDPPYNILNNGDKIEIIPKILTGM